jgi:subfamily B ATP-binding cassette protein HlyB/CyaB
VKREMTDVTAQTEPPKVKPAPAFNRMDPGLAGLAVIAAYYRIAADPAQLRHQLALTGRFAEAADIVRAANILDLRSRLLRGVTAKRLAAIPYPALIGIKGGAFGVLAVGSAKGLARLIDPIAGIAREMPIEEIATLSSGEVVLITRRLGGAGANPRTFGFRWFLPSILRYRRPLAQVMVASLFVQLFALITPIFFQLIVDKVLVHKGLSTLTVLIVGMVTLGLFESILQFLRAYTLSHTTNRIDVELGRRLFHHLFRLPLAYFETRAAGQTVARVRELETIRSFLTGQGLTSLLDLVFTLVFFLVMFIYSARLTLVVLGAIPIYLLIATLIVPVLRQLINEKFNRGARSQQFLVESIVGAPTLKAASVEPMMQAQWEERLASYVSKSFDAGITGLGRPEPHPVCEQGDDGADPAVRRHFGDRRHDDRRRADRVQHDRLTGGAADLAAIATLAGLPAGPGFGGTPRRHLERAA